MSKMFREQQVFLAELLSADEDEIRKQQEDAILKAMQQLRLLSEQDREQQKSWNSEIKLYPSKSPRGVKQDARGQERQVKCVRKENLCRQLTDFS